MSSNPTATPGSGGTSGAAPSPGARKGGSTDAEASNESPRVDHGFWHRTLPKAAPKNKAPPLRSWDWDEEKSEESSPEPTPSRQKPSRPPPDEKEAEEEQEDDEEEPQAEPEGRARRRSRSSKERSRDRKIAEGFERSLPMLIFAAICLFLAVDFWGTPTHIGARSYPLYAMFLLIGVTAATGGTWAAFAPDDLEEPEAGGATEERSPRTASSADYIIISRPRWERIQEELSDIEIAERAPPSTKDYIVVSRDKWKGIQNELSDLKIMVNSIIPSDLVEAAITPPAAAIPSEEGIEAEVEMLSARSRAMELGTVDLPTKAVPPEPEGTPPNFPVTVSTEPAMIPVPLTPPSPVLELTAAEVDREVDALRTAFITGVDRNDAEPSERYLERASLAHSKSDVASGSVVRVQAACESVLGAYHHLSTKQLIEFSGRIQTDLQQIETETMVPLLPKETPREYVTRVLDALKAKAPTAQPRPATPASSGAGMWWSLSLFRGFLESHLPEGVAQGVMTEVEREAKGLAPPAAGKDMEEDLRRYGELVKVSLRMRAPTILRWDQVDALCHEIDTFVGEIPSPRAPATPSPETIQKVKDSVQQLERKISSVQPSAPTVVRPPPAAPKASIPLPPTVRPPSPPPTPLPLVEVSSPRKTLSPPATPPPTPKVPPVIPKAVIPTAPATPPPQAPVPSVPNVPAVPTKIVQPLPVPPPRKSPAAAAPVSTNPTDREIEAFYAAISSGVDRDPNEEVSSYLQRARTHPPLDGSFESLVRQGRAGTSSLAEAHRRLTDSQMKALYGFVGPEAEKILGQAGSPRQPGESIEDFIFRVLHSPVPRRPPAAPVPGRKIPAPTSMTPLPRPEVPAMGGLKWSLALFRGVLANYLSVPTTDAVVGAVETEANRQPMPSESGEELLVYARLVKNSIKALPSTEIKAEDLVQLNKAIDQFVEDMGTPENARGSGPPPQKTKEGAKQAKDQLDELFAALMGQKPD